MGEEVKILSRYLRMEYKYGIYHVIARGNNKEYIFKDSIDKGYFIKLIKECKVGMGFKLYAYVLMDNHYHLLIQTMDKKLHEIMHQINNKYSKYYNYKNKRVGHVFQGRYKSILIQDERYMMALVRYIHHNPIRASICGKVEDYKWSSDIFYRKSINSFVDTNIVFDMLSKKRDEAINKYFQYMFTSDDEEVKRFEEANIIGDEAYIAMMETRKQKIDRIRLDEILIATGISDQEYYEIKNGSRKRCLTEYKQEYIRKAIELKYTHKEIGENIKITDASVRDLMKK